jgi:signal transduction histidine kinase
MGRVPKPTKGKAKPAVSRTSRRSGDGVRDLDKRLAEAQQREAEALDQQTATAEILRVIASSPTDIQPVFDTVAASAASLCRASDTSIFRLDGDRLRRVAHHGSIPAGVIGEFTIPLVRGSFAGRCVLDGRIVHIADGQTEANEFPEGSELARRLGFRAILLVPLLREGVAIGAITLRRTEPQLFTDRQVTLLQTFADQAVIAIENVRLFKELEARNAQLTELLGQQTATGEILSVIARSPTDIQPVFDTVVESAARLCEANDVAIYRLDGDQLRFVAHHGSIPPPGPVGEYFRTLERGSATGRSVLEGRILHIADLQAEADEFPTTSDIARRLGFRALLSVPLMRGGAAIGTIMVRRTEARLFSERQVALLKTFADQAVIAIENVRLFTELQEKNRALTDAHAQVSEALEQQTATAEVLRVISGSPTDLQPVFDSMLQSAVRLLSGFGGAILLYDGSALQLGAVTGGRPQSGAEDWFRSIYPLPLDPETPIGIAILERRMIQLPDTEESPSQITREVARGFQFRALVTVPMLRDGSAIGTISITRAAPGAFSERQVEVLQTFADQAVIAIENVRLFKELEARNRDLTATSEILRVISTSPTDVQPVLDALVESAGRLCQAADTFLLLIERDQLRTVAGHGPGYLGNPGLSYSINRGWVTGRAVVDMQAVHVEDLVGAEAEFPLGVEIAARFGHRTALALPLLRQGVAIGALFLRRQEVRRFSDKEIQLLQTFADQAVIAIENVRLFKELDTRNRELTQALDRETATGEILRVINSSPTSAEPVFDAILANGMRLCQADVGLLFLVEGDTFRLVADRGASPEFVEPRRTAHRSGPHTGIARAVQERRPIHIEDLLVDRAYIERDPARLQTIELLGARSGVWVPLLKEEMAIGVLVTWRREVRRFTDAEIEVLTTFANQAVIAIENVRLLRDLDEKSRQLEVASQHKSEFLANMSHELRTPLNAIIGFSEVLAEKMFGELNQKQEEYSKDIHASGQHLLSLINDILDLSKIEAGRMELELTDFHLPTALDSALTLVRERAGRRSIALHLSVDQRLGQIQGDERKVRQVVLNLLSNAIKFTPEGGRIEVAAMPKNGFVEVSVRDTGVGIAPNDQEAVFEEFRQVGTADKKVEGTGLGLTLCRKFVELHGGTIWVKSELGKGSTFTFTIPVRHGE